MMYNLYHYYEKEFTREFWNLIQNYSHKNWNWCYLSMNPNITLDIIKENPNITQKELAAKTGLTRRGVEWNLKKLKDVAVIERVGSDKGGHWEIIKNR